MRAGTQHSVESKEAIGDGVRTNLRYREAAAAARALIWAGVPAGDPRLMALAREARDLATGYDKAHWEKIVGILEAGRQIRTSVYPATFSTMGDLLDAQGEEEGADASAAEDASS